MTTVFPNNLDSFVNPTSASHLNTPAVLHSTQHQNLNDAVSAIEIKIGVISSSIPATIQYELHNAMLGHNHNGLNSRTIANLPIGPILMGTGPVEGWAYNSVSGAYHEYTYTNNVFPATMVWYSDSGKNRKIAEKVITRNANKTPSTIVWNLYDRDGTTILTKVTDSINYNGSTIFESARSRVVSSSINYSTF